MVATAAALALVPSFAVAQGTDQYRPAPPPEAPSGAGTVGGGGGGDSVTAGGGGLAAPSPSSAASPAPTPVEVDGGSGGIKPTSGDPATEVGAPGEAEDPARGRADKVQLPEGEPLSIAASRPPLALGAQASQGGIGALPLLLGAAVALTGIAVVARRGANARAGSGRAE